MQKQKSYADSPFGKLYLVPTPIGNLEDMSVRAVNCLTAVSLIASEDTRLTQKLLNHFQISTPQMSFHAHNYKERIPQLLARLKQGEAIAQVSDAGMPSVSDPGHELVEACLKEEIAVIALPGPTAGLTALIASGLPVQPFTFYGFIPRKKSEQAQLFHLLQTKTETYIFYESPHRIAATVAAMQDVLGAKRRIVICRELTKRYEEYLRGTLQECALYLAQTPLKGECCLLLAGAQSADFPETEAFPDDLKTHVEQLMANGYTSKEAIKAVAAHRQLKKQDVYKAYHMTESSEN